MGRPMVEMERSVTAAADEFKALARELRQRLAAIPPDETERIVGRLDRITAHIDEMMPKGARIVDSADVVNSRLRKLASDLDRDDDGDIDLDDIQWPSWLTSLTSLWPVIKKYLFWR